ncbi:hypothetical protein Tco_1117024 [Tanacetum coccineum]
MNLESRCIYDGRVVFPDFDDLVYVGSMFSHIGFDCLLKINEQIYPRFILEFYSQYRVNYTLEGQMLIEFGIQNQFFSYIIEEFGQILGTPSNGACSFTDKWSLDDMQYSVPTSGPYQPNPPCPNEIKNYVQEEREGSFTRIRHEKVIDVEENQILTREIVTLSSNRYVLYDCVMYPLTAQQERKTQNDDGTRRGCSSTYSSSAFGQPSSSHLHDDDDDNGNDEGTSRASTPSPACFVNSLTNEVPRVFSNPPNIDPNMEPFYTRQTKILNHQVQLTTYSLFESKPQSLLPSSNDTPSPQPSNPFLDNIMDVPPRPSNPIPLQSHPSLDITLSLSLITPLDHILDTPSPPSP